MSDAPDSLKPIEPHPGTNEAIEAGCLCPILDNRHGRGHFMAPDGVYGYNEGCPIHWPKPEARND